MQKNVWPWYQESYLLNIVTGCCVISPVKHRKPLVNFQRMTEHGCYFSGGWKTTDNASKVFKEKRFIFHTLICLLNIEQSKDEGLGWKEKLFSQRSLHAQCQGNYGILSAIMGLLIGKALGVYEWIIRRHTEYDMIRICFCLWETCTLLKSLNPI